MPVDRFHTSYNSFWYQYSTLKPFPKIRCCPRNPGLVLDLFMNRGPIWYGGSFFNIRGIGFLIDIILNGLFIVVYHHPYVVSSNCYAIRSNYGHTLTHYSCLVVYNKWVPICDQKPHFSNTIPLFLRKILSGDQSRPAQRHGEQRWSHRRVANCDRDEESEPWGRWEAFRDGKAHGLRRGSRRF